MGSRGGSRPGMGEVGCVGPVWAGWGRYRALGLGMRADFVVVREGGGKPRTCVGRGIDMRRGCTLQRAS